LKQQGFIKQIDPQIMNKLISVKIIVVARVLMALIFAILTWTDSMEPTDTVSYNDLNVGLHIWITLILSFLTAFLMMPFYRAVQFQRKPLVDLPGAETGYAPRVPIEYDEDGNAKIGSLLVKPEVKPKASPFKALLDTINIIDVFRAVWRGVKLIGKKDGYLAAPQEDNELPDYRGAGSAPPPA
jgi:hypothetical protein